MNVNILRNTTSLAWSNHYVWGQGVGFNEKMLSHVAPVKWDYIALTGDYLWSETEQPRERIRPLRTSRFTWARSCQSSVDGFMERPP